VKVGNRKPKQARSRVRSNSKGLRTKRYGELGPTQGMGGIRSEVKCGNQGLVANVARPGDKCMDPDSGDWNWEGTESR